jgi:hypothetical protein
MKHIVKGRWTKLKALYICKNIFLYLNYIEFDGYRALANGEWNHLNCLSTGNMTDEPIILLSLSTAQQKLFETYISMAENQMMDNKFAQKKRNRIRIEILINIDDYSQHKFLS